MRSLRSLGLVVLTASLGVFTLAGCGTNTSSIFSSVGAGAGGEGGTLGVGTSGGTGGAGGVSTASTGVGGAQTASSSVSTTTTSTGTGPGSSASSSSANSSSANSSSASGGNPQACGQCAFQQCQTEIFQCGQPCQGFAQCTQACSDQPCVDACLQQYPQAQATYDCTCSNCSDTCNGTVCFGGSSSSVTSTNAASSSVATSSSSGGGNCATCSQIFQGSADDPCPGSDTKLQDLLVCVCQTQCTQACSASCQTGSQPTQACFQCLQGKCSAQLQACLND